ncbi:MAG: hypothetical protein PUE80_07225, partial [bacterium]|nr:hypothetical protein [bacterium]
MCSTTCTTTPHPSKSSNCYHTTTKNLTNNPREIFFQLSPTAYFGCLHPNNPHPAQRKKGLQAIMLAALNISTLCLS